MSLEQEHYEADGAITSLSLEDAFEVARAEKSDEIFVIGGGELYKEALPFADKLYMTLIDDEKELTLFSRIRNSIH